MGTECEENLSLRYRASSLTEAGFRSVIGPFNRAQDLPGVLAALLESAKRKTSGCASTPSIGESRHAVVTARRQLDASGYSFLRSVAS